MFAHSKDQAWVGILLKAVAKACGSYAQAMKVPFADCWQLLTAKPVTRVALSNAE